MIIGILRLWLVRWLWPISRLPSEDCHCAGHVSPYSYGAPWPPFAGVKSEIQTERAKGEPWLILWAGLAFPSTQCAGLPFMPGWLRALQKSSMTEKLDTIPFCWAPLCPRGVTSFLVHGLQISKADRRKARETGIRQENLSVFVLPLAAAPLVANEHDDFLAAQCVQLTQRRRVCSSTSALRRTIAHPTAPRRYRDPVRSERVIAVLNAGGSCGLIDRFKVPTRAK